MLGTILKDPEHSITSKSTCERPEIEDVNVSNSINIYVMLRSVKIIKIYNIILA